VPTAEPVKVRRGGGVGVSELRNKLGNMMMHPAQHHAPAGPGISLHSCLPESLAMPMVVARIGF